MHGCEQRAMRVHAWRWTRGERLHGRGPGVWSPAEGARGAEGAGSDPLIPAHPPPRSWPRSTVCPEASTMGLSTR